MKSKMKYAMMFIALLAFAPMLCLAGDYDPHYNFYMSNNIWMMVATFLVFTISNAIKFSHFTLKVLDSFY